MTAVIQGGKDSDPNHRKQNELNRSEIYFGSKMNRIQKRYGKFETRKKVINKNSKIWMARDNYGSIYVKGKNRKEVLLWGLGMKVLLWTGFDVQNLILLILAVT